MDGGFKSSAVAILFSVEDYTATGGKEDGFASFFDSIKLSEDDPKVQKVALREALANVDWSQRWVYKGSRT